MSRLEYRFWCVFAWVLMFPLGLLRGCWSW
jgi:hypothetical protein